MTHPDRSRPAEKMAVQKATGRGVQRIPYPIGVRTATLLRRERVTERMMRLTIGGAALDGTHNYQADDHVKVLFPNADGVLRLPVPNERQALDWPADGGPTRSYTIRRYDPQLRELDLDVVLHDGGLASDWAQNAELGSEVALAGPPGAKAWPHTYDHYLFVGDSTALPAIARWLDENPTFRAEVVVATEHDAQRDYPLALADRAGVTWLPDGAGEEALLAAADAALAAMGAGRGFVFAAGEAEFIKPLRRWSKGRLDAVITGYWKRGVDDFDEH